MARVDVSRYQTFGDITERLDSIVSQVRDKDVSLERSLDLFDEAIALGSKAVSLVDATDFSPEEEARLDRGAGGREGREQRRRQLCTPLRASRRDAPAHGRAVAPCPALPTWLDAELVEQGFFSTTAPGAARRALGGRRVNDRPSAHRAGASRSGRA